MLEAFENKNDGEGEARTYFVQTHDFDHPRFQMEYLLAPDPHAYLLQIAVSSNLA